MSEVARKSQAPIRDETVDPDFDVADYLDGIAAFVGGTANVIMQLSLRPVGYGVLESSVDSGKVMLHPVKRLRTTLSYLAVAALGTDDERARYRDAVNGQHRPVHSGPDSPVRYNAFDPELQLWVAAMLHWGFVDVVERLHGPLDAASSEALYRHGARMGTTLQVRPEMWPADRAAFEKYVADTFASQTIDPPIRDYFNDLIDLKMLPLPIRFVGAPVQRYFVTGLLPPHLRDEMGMRWSAADERRFARVMRVLGTVSAHLPGPVRRFPVNYYLWDLRMRMRLNRPLV